MLSWARHARPLRNLYRGYSTRVEDARWPGWDVVIGIEVHAQIKSRRKLFSGEALTCFALSIFMNH